MNKKMYRLDTGLILFTDALHQETEYALDLNQKEKYDQIMERLNNSLNNEDSSTSVMAYPIGHLIVSHGADIYGIVSTTPVSVPAQRLVAKHTNE